MDPEAEVDKLSAVSFYFLQNQLLQILFLQSNAIIHNKLLDRKVQRVGKKLWVVYTVNIEMRIGLLSDTHILKVSGGIPPQVKEVFRCVDLILHAGDIYDVCVLDELESIALVLAARGDEDLGAVLADKRVKDKHSLTVEGVRLTLSHEVESPGWLGDRVWNLNRLASEERYTNLEGWCGSVADIFIFGHTHQALVDYYQGFLLVNPGSPTIPNYKSKRGTVGLLTIASGKVEVRIVQL